MVIWKGDPTLHIRQVKTKFKMPFIRRGEKKKTWYLFFGNMQMN